MRNNLSLAAIQTGASVSLALLSIAIFRFLAPDQVAFLRQYYLVPFALITAFAPANQNYLRSILFSNSPQGDVLHEIYSLIAIQSATGIALLFGVAFLLDRSGDSATWLNMATLFLALFLVLSRTIITGLLEFGGNYFHPILLNSIGGTTPYVAAVSLAFIANQNCFYFATIALTTLNIVVLFHFINRPSNWKPFNLRHLKETQFKFSFLRYLTLSQISIGSVIVYQGVEFLLYNHTSYSQIEVANYGLAFSTIAIIRQIILAAIQPLERQHANTTTINIPSIGQFKLTSGIEVMIYFILAAAILLISPIISFAFPRFSGAATFIPPLILGILGSAIQQIHSVQMIAFARTSFLGNTQILLAGLSVAAVLLFSPALSMIQLVWLLSFFIWIRGCIAVPLYADIINKKGPSPLWIARLIFSAAISLPYFGFSITDLARL